MLRVFTGYIDESGDAKTHLFTLSCLTGHGSQWQWIEWMWLNCLEKKNRELKAANRPQLSRYHASDCSSRLGEFKDWSTNEQIIFTDQLIRVFQRHPLVITSYTLNIHDLVAEFPEAEKEPYALAHVIALNHIMMYVSEKVLGDERWLHDRLGLVHDRSKYDSVLSEAFHHMKNDPTLNHRDRFTTISSMGWEDCVPLQPADLIAYENFKLVERESVGAKRRKSFERILDLDSIGGRGVKLQRSAFVELREKLDSESTRILFENARV